MKTYATIRVEDVTNGKVLIDQSLENFEQTVMEIIDKPFIVLVGITYW